MTNCDFDDIEVMLKRAKIEFSVEQTEGTLAIKIDAIFGSDQNQGYSDFYTYMRFDPSTRLLLSIGAYE